MNYRGHRIGHSEVLQRSFDEDGNVQSRDWETCVVIDGPQVSGRALTEDQAQDIIDCALVGGIYEPRA